MRAARSKPDAHASEKRFAVEVVEVALIQRCCVDAHQQLVVFDNRAVDVLVLDGIARGQGGRLTRTAPEVHFGQEFVPATLTLRREAAP